ncbi:MAG: hypothetical protein ACAI35_06970 [Candidatus Methylacidiphilales bacterium]
MIRNDNIHAAATPRGPRPASLEEPLLRCIFTRRRAIAEGPCARVLQSMLPMTAPVQMARAPCSRGAGSFAKSPTLPLQ